MENVDRSSGSDLGGDDSAPPEIWLSQRRWKVNCVLPDVVRQEMEDRVAPDRDWDERHVSLIFGYSRQYWPHFFSTLRP